MAVFKKTNYQAKYPGLKLNDEIIECLNRSDRKMFYQEHDIKDGSIKVNEAERIVKFISGREDSYERLQEDDNQQFQIEIENVENIAIRQIQIKKMMRYIKTLSGQEQELIYSLYFKGNSERQMSAETGVHYMTVHNRKVRILSKLKKLMEK